MLHVLALKDVMIPIAWSYWLICGICKHTFRDNLKHTNIQRDNTVLYTVHLKKYAHIVRLCRVLFWIDSSGPYSQLTHWGRVTHVCVSKLTIIGSDNGLSPGRRQAIIWTNAGILVIRPLGTNFNEMLVEILTFSFMKMRLKVSSGKWRPFCLGLNELTDRHQDNLTTTPATVKQPWRIWASGQQKKGLKFCQKNKGPGG